MYTLQYRQWLKGEKEYTGTYDGTHLDREELKQGLNDVVKNIETVRTKYHDCLESDNDGRDELKIAEVMLSNVARVMNVEQPTAQEVKIADKSVEILEEAKLRLTNKLKDHQRMDDEAPCCPEGTSEHVHEYSKAIAKVNDASTKLNEFIREIVHDML